MPEPHLRASDADRAAVAEVLGAHMSAGRLSVAEYDERLARAYAARTYGELDELTTDLPATPPATTAGSGSADVPQPAAPWTTSPWAHGMSACAPWAGAGLRAAWASWAATALICIGIWLFTSVASGGLIYPWPIWVIGPWGAVLLFQTLPLGQDRGGRGRQRQLDAAPGETNRRR
jgi:hypothetical protein